MRILLVSDTHGALSAIDDLVERESADAVVHAGDFGFYDDISPDRLDGRELFLRVVHSDLSAEEKSRAQKLKGAALVQYVRDHAPLSDLAAYLRCDRDFKVPVFAVWGNHEDREVIAALLDGRARVKNLTLLAPGVPVDIGPLRVVGLPGNVIVDRLYDVGQTPVGRGGKIWATLAEIGRTLAAFEHPRQPCEIRVFVSHVSPGKEPIIGRIAAWLDADLTISGHMGAPYCVVWNEFAVRTEDDLRGWLDRVAPGKAPADHPDREAIERALVALRTLPSDVRGKRGVVHPSSYFRPFHVNLPDIVDGWAVLTWDGLRLGLETRSKGIAWAALRSDPAKL